MMYSDGESYGDAEIFSEAEDLVRDEAEEKGDDEKNDSKEPDEEKPSEKTKVQKKPQRIVKNPRKTLNFDTLRGSNGLSALQKLFKDFHFKGDDHEIEDLTRVMTILQQWMSYQLCPQYSFETCMDRLEILGKKKIVQTLMKKFRSGIADWGETQPDKGDGEVEERNDFDVLLDEEIANAKSDGEFSEDEAGGNVIQQNPQTEEVTLTPEQLERIAKNKKLAEERRLKRMSQQYGQTSGQINLPFGMSRKEALSQFIQQIHGRPVVVKLNSGVDYRGVLACLDGYMNIALEQTEEYVNGQLKNKYGDAFIRGNNVLYISTQKRRI